MNSDQYADDALCSFFLTLSDPTRLKLLRFLMQEESTVGSLADRLGESQPKISRHLAFLRDRNVVATRRDGKHIFYSICEMPTPGHMILTATFGITASEPARTRTAEDRADSQQPDEELPVYLL